MNFKKRISVGLSLSLVLSTSSLASAMPNRLVRTPTNSKEQLQVLQAQIQQEEALKSLVDSDKVRVVVELKGEPVIQIATTQGLKINQMNMTEVESMQNSILKEQQNIQNAIDDKGINFKVINSFTNVANGFSVETTLGEAKKLEGIKDIKSVSIANEYDRPEPMMNNSSEIINSHETWALGYNGEGTVVAIIDTGIDSTHKDMILTSPDKAELQIDEVTAIAKENKLAGVYETPKVPYGYNYMDQNEEILDLGPAATMHGMHVAGIVGANGDTKNGGIKGVAPESQLLAMKVFGNNPAMPSTFGDVIVKAIDDSVLLGADVINMSLGSTASYVDDTDLEQTAVNRAVDNGVVMAISAGNSNVFGNGYAENPYPYAENPDYGVVGSPGIATDSIQVASIENNIISGFGLEYEISGVASIAPYTTSGPDMIAFKGQPLKVIDCGLGGVSTDFTEAVKGNIALIQRGSYNFTDKISNAEKAGASGVIVYNNAGGGDGLISMLYPEGGTIPAIFIGNSHGSKISAQCKLIETTVVLNGNPASAVNPSAGKMSDFTSWGTTPNLDFKPEITAPGGNIWSTANNNSYQNMSGTSMASPHIAGGAALVLQRVDKEFALTGQARALMAKNLLMSTAKAHVDNGDYQSYGALAGPNFTSPRRQGAGVMDIQAATTTSAIVTENITRECKINLKEIKGDTATFDITVTNFSDKELTYNVDGTVQTDLSNSGFTLLEAQNIISKDSGKFPLSFSKDVVVVPAKGTETITGTINLANAIGCDSGVSIEEMFKNGGYVEGFVTLIDPTDTNPELSIPYIGFKGEWDKAPIIDASIYDTINSSFYGFTSILSADEKEFLGVDMNDESDSEKIAFSPNGDNVNDAILPVLSYLRNAKELEVEILDSTGKVIKTVTKEANLNKHYFDSKYDKYSILTSATWDGKVNNSIVADGQYTYRVKSKIDFKDALWQNLDFKVNVDTVKPTITSVDYDKATSKLTVVADDNIASNVYKYVITNDGEEITSNDTGIFDLNAVDYKTCTVNVYDFARNIETLNLIDSINGEFKEPTGATVGDKTIPTIMVTAPEFFGVLPSSKVTVTGTVKDVSAITEFTVNAKSVPLTFDTNTGLWNFSAEVELEDGYHSIMLSAKDAANNKIGFAHKVFIDTVAPVIKLDSIAKETSNDSIIITGMLTDNLPSMKVKVNGNMVKNIAPDWSYFDTLPAAEYKLAYTVDLVAGENKVVIEALDTANHITTQELIVKKVAVVVPPVISGSGGGSSGGSTSGGGSSVIVAPVVPIPTKVDTILESTKLMGSNRYKTAIEVSKSGWVTSNVAVIANGYAFADALVAAPLAASYDAPILLTETSKLQADTKAELLRLGTKTVYVVGGTGVVSDAAIAEMSNAGINVIRVSGVNRYETSVEVAKYLAKQQKITNVYVSNGYAPADALTIASKAAIDKSPIILVDQKSVSKEVSDWLTSQNLKSAYVIGGVGVVSASVMDALNKLTSEDITANRLGGANRYETNALVVGKFFNKEQTNIYVTESIKLVDALVIAPLAAKTGSPVLITTESLASTQKTVADTMTAKKVIEVGGQVSKSAVKELIDILNK
ncbi:cell wall-binding repeat-containing protein [Clostridium sp.]